jgi:aminoglycoside phosphotransferase family enzyme
MRFMSDPASHNLPAHGINADVERIDTHGAAVFLAGDRAYKVKRAVCFPFMDFSTLARREEACRAEIAINKPNAPEIYLDTVAITRDKLGHLAINGQGEAIEWAVAMRRFDTEMTFDRLAQSRPADPDRSGWRRRRALAFQERAPSGGPMTGCRSELLHRSERPGLSRGPQAVRLQETAALTQRTFAEWRRVRPILLARGEAQAVRRCHGDLHLRNWSVARRCAPV